MTDIAERIYPSKLEIGDSNLQDHLVRYQIASLILESGDSVVDAACGSGYGTYLLAKNCARITGMDIANEALEYAREHYQAANISYTETDITQLGINECDVLVSFETIEHLEDYDGFIEAVKNKTRKYIIISVPITPTKHLNKYHKHDFTREAVESLMEPWHPNLYCLQAGVGGELCGIWVFGREKQPTPEILKINLEAQRLLFKSLYDENKKNKNWAEELEKTNCWFDKHNREIEKKYSDFKKWAEEIEKANRWLEKEYSDSKKWAAELERANQWLKEQNKNVENQYLELKKWAEKLDSANQWLANQNENLNRALKPRVKKKSGEETRQR